MKTSVRRIQQAVLAAVLAIAVLPSATAQAAPVVDSVSGNMLFAMHTEFAAALQSQGFTYSYLGYTQGSGSWYGGFPVLGGSLNEVTGFGEILCAGDLRYVNGPLTMDIRNMQFSNTLAGETLTAQIYLNGAAQGRRTIFTSSRDQLYGITAGMTVTQNSYLTFDPSFKSLFINFFQVPQLQSALDAQSVGFIAFTILLQPIQ